MLTRREFGKALGGAAVGAVAAPYVASSAVPVIRLGNAAGINDAQLSFLTVGRHPKLGFYSAEGVDVDVINMNSSSQTLQALATGSVDVTNLSIATYLPLVAKNPSLNIISAYVWLRQNQAAVGVKPDSPLQSVADLKGKKIGIRNQGDTGYITMLSEFEELGLDPQKDAEWVSVGSGGPAGAALYNGHVDALAIWDGELARVEIAGFKLRYLPNTPGVQHLFGGTYGVGRDALARDRARLSGFFRAMAKSTIVAGTNPEAAVRLHWELYPESKPKGKSEADALKEALYIIASRRAKWFAAPWQTDKRMGASSLEEWQAWSRYTKTGDKIKDVSVLFTNDLIAAANDFDHAAVEQQAKALQA
jgi:NitT/TauT family transport system substrate-binding protein